MFSIAKDIKNKLKNNSPMEKITFPIFLSLSLKEMKINPSSIIYADIFSKFNPIINEVIVVAILLPSIIPIELLKVNSLAFINPIVSIITAELDWMRDVAIKPTVKLLYVDDVKFSIFCFTLFKDKVIKLLLNKSIECIKRIIPPINRVKVINITIKIYCFF